MTWFAFIAGLIAGCLLAWLWMRARVARVEAAKQFAESGATKLQETFQALADAALRSNQTALLDVALWFLRPTWRPTLAVVNVAIAVALGLPTLAYVSGLLVGIQRFAARYAVVVLTTWFA